MKHKNIDKELLKKYLNGELRGEEAYELERIILARKFESEAQEGLDTLTGDEFSADLTALEKRVDQRTSASGNSSFKITYYARIAAAIVFIAVSGFFLYNYVSTIPVTENSLSQTEELLPADTSTYNDVLDTGFIALADKEIDMEPENSNVTSEVPSSEPEISPVTNEPENIDAGIVSQENTIPDIVGNEEAEEAVSEDFIAQDLSLTTIDTFSLGDEKKAEENQSLLRSTTESKRKSAAAAPTAASINEVQDSRTILVNGKVTGAGENGPLPGANILIKGTSVGTVSDMDGNFSIEVPAGETLNVSFVGFNSRDIPVSDSNDLIIRLDQNSSSLSEVVITAYGINNATKEVVNSNAQPVGGKEAFNTYVDENMIYPPQALENGINGRVVVLFNVSNSGVLSDFRIRRGLGYGCDEEAIRLIQEGPAWQAGNSGLMEEVRVTINFKE